MRLVDLDKAREEYRNLMDLTMSDTTLLHTLYGVLDNAPTVKAIPKSDYENHLKADMVAMLTEIEKKIDEQCKIPNNCASAYDWNNGVYACYKVIQQKINSLKENKS